HVEPGAHDPRAVERVGPPERGSDAGDVLVRHGRGEQGQGGPVRGPAGTTGETRSKVVEGGRECRGTGRVVRSIEEHLATIHVEQLEAAGAYPRRITRHARR